MIKELRELLILHEGLRLEPYQCTAGKWTIGVGYNYEDRGFSTEVLTRIINEGFTEALAYELLEDDIDDVIKQLTDAFIWFPQLDKVRMIAICDMCFNLGLDGLKRFKKMLSAMERQDYKTASLEAMDSRWFKQVGSRGKTIVYMIKNGYMP